MGRQNKVDLPYFELDCHMDDKIELIEAEYGLKGFAIVIKLYQRIYGGEFGYYCEFTPDIALLLASRFCGSSGGVSGRVGIASDKGSLPGFPNNLITDVVAASIRRHIFSEQLFNEYGILTSSGIQKQYLKATAKREVIELKEEYLLISIPKNRNNVVINSISGGRNVISGGRNAQSKSKTRLDNNIIYSSDPHDQAPDKEEQLKEEYCPSDFERKCVNFLIQSILNDLPNQKVPSTDKEIGKWAIHINRLHRIDGISESDIWNTLVWTMKDTFWRTNIRSTGKFREKYQTLYLQSKRDNRNSNKNRFNDFKQNEYDFDVLEKELTQN